MRKSGSAEKPDTEKIVSEFSLYPVQVSVERKSVCLPGLQPVADTADCAFLPARLWGGNG